MGYLGQRDYSIRAWLDPHETIGGINITVTAPDVQPTPSSTRTSTPPPASSGQPPSVLNQPFEETDRHVGPAHHAGAIRRHHRQGRPDQARNGRTPIRCRRLPPGSACPTPSLPLPPRVPPRAVPPRPEARAVPRAAVAAVRALPRAALRRAAYRPSGGFFSSGRAAALASGGRHQHQRRRDRRGEAARSSSTSTSSSSSSSSTSTSIGAAPSSSSSSGLGVTTASSSGLSNGSIISTTLDRGPGRPSASIVRLKDVARM